MVTVDLVYPVRPGNVNEELRYSLRSVEANYPHGRVWIVGDQPNWLTGVEFIRGNTQPHPRANIYHNLLAACAHPDLADEFVIFNDDFFVTEPVEGTPMAYRSTLRQHLNLPRLRTSQSWWKDSLTTTLICLQAVGIDEPLSYELHVPFPVNKALMAATLEQFKNVTPANPPQWRSLYGNLHASGAVMQPDSKVFRPGPLRTPYHSTTDVSWRNFRTTFRTLFPEPSPYELDNGVIQQSRGTRVSTAV